MRPEPNGFSSSMLAREIPIRGRNGEVRAVAIVSPEDYERLAQRSWHLVQTSTCQYARRWERLADGSERYIWMHREIMGAPHGDRSIEIDHVDGDGLNNQRSNLLFSDRKRNGQTRRKLKAATSKYRGVCWSKQAQKWQAQIRVDGKRINLGQYADEKQAAVAARAGRRKYLPHSRN